MSAVLALAFSWTQNVNFWWGFQIQFVLATLLPLLAFLAVTRAWGADKSPRRASGWFALGTLLTILSVGTMASGLTVPYIGLALVVVLGGHRKRTITLASLAVALTALYLFRYQSPAHHGDPLSTVVHHPVAVAHYLVTYLGSPLELASGSHLLGLASGTVFVAAFGWSALSTSRHARPAGVREASGLHGLRAHRRADHGDG